MSLLLFTFNIKLVELFPTIVFSIKCNRSICLGFSFLVNNYALIQLSIHLKENYIGFPKVLFPVKNYALIHN